MTKIRKVKRRKRYRMNVNRKRLRNKLRKLPTINCSQIKQSWEATKSTRTNLNQMGLAYDSNDALKIPNTKREFIKEVLKKKDENDEDKLETEEDVEMIPPKVYVAQELEAEAKAPRRKMFRLPNNQVYFLTYLMDKYGEDYKNPWMHGTKCIQSFLMAFQEEVLSDIQLFLLCAYEERYLINLMLS
ncbi:unnamed protein product [Heterotrigona itama]|uniref:Nucleolar protein 16 n=1 Tax=Heterotrigona itama TaxID=395501 RepID=A0A6V7H6K2_9HYME|nr:unnamed protein product [Heterotrigona itama]